MLAHFMEKDTMFEKPAQISHDVWDMLTLIINAQEKGYIGESMSQYMHALQTAYCTQLHGGTELEIVAALLHDIGHLCAPVDTPKMDGLGTMHHDDIGADYLDTLGFDPHIVDLVRNHVNAKRFLCWYDATYYDTLSDASQGTLQFQGGRMHQAEAITFQRHPNFRGRIIIRKSEERGKYIGENVVPHIEVYYPLIQKYTK